MLNERPTTAAAPGKARIQLEGVTKRFLTPSGEPFTALHDVNIVVEPGQFCAIVGPTGCGKSTTLTLVSGLDRASAGVVSVGGVRLRDSGILADVAPTVLALLGIPQPQEMTGQSLVE